MLWPTMASKVPDNRYPKDSFDRFGDDLSQLVLKYLSLEDRFRFECVSKQWQRVVYLTQQELTIGQKMVKKWTKYSFFGTETIDWTNLKTILTKKCPNIRSIDLHRNRIEYKTIYKIMDLLAEWTPNISSFEVHSTDGESPTDLLGLIDHIVVYRELRHLTIDCPRVSGDSNPCVNSMNKVADSCRHIQSMELNLKCFTADNLLNLLNDIKLFNNLRQLHLGLYSPFYEEPKQISVKPLLDCRRLTYVELDCSQHLDYTDVDLLRRQGVRVTTTKHGPQWQPIDYKCHLPFLQSLDNLINQ